jgi:hypothetical protein
MNDFEEEFFDSQFDDDSQKKADEAFLERYYSEVLSALINTGFASETGSEEVVPYEVVVFSDQPGVLYTK